MLMAGAMAEVPTRSIHALLCKFVSILPSTPSPPNTSEGAPQQDWRATGIFGNLGSDGGHRGGPTMKEDEQQ